MAGKRIVRIVGLLWCLAALLAGGAWGATSALGAEGEVLRVVAGSYGSLFPEGSEAPTDSEVLALEIRAADGSSDRLLVPETSSHAAENAPALVYEQSTGTAYLLWQGTLGLIHSVLHLTSYDGEGWGPVFEITGNPFTRKLSPQLRVTRDRHAGADVEAGEVLRTAIHVAWGEESGGGTLKRWAPILIEDGRHLSWMPTWNLDDLLPAVESPAIGANHTALRLRDGSSDGAVIVGYLTTWGDRVAVIEIELLPGELESLANDGRLQLDPAGMVADGYDDLAAAIHDFIAGHQDGFHPASLEHIADAAAAAVAATDLPWGAEGWGAAAETARLQILHSGASFSPNGLADADPFTILAVDRPDDSDHPHLLKVTVRSLRDAPEGIGAEPALYLSDHGTDVIIAWQSEGAVHYIESVADGGWSETRSVVLGDTFDLASVERMLEARIASR